MPCLLLAVYISLNGLFKFLNAMHLKNPLNSIISLYFLFAYTIYLYLGLFSCDFSVQIADVWKRAQGSNTHICNLKHEIKDGTCLIFV